MAALSFCRKDGEEGRKGDVRLRYGCNAFVERESGSIIFTRERARNDGERRNSFSSFSWETVGQSVADTDKWIKDLLPLPDPGKRKSFRAWR